MAKIVNLVCEECLSRNYHVQKNGGLQERLALKKYCPHCNRATIHKETR